METILNRLDKFMATKGLKDRQLEMHCGISNGLLNNIRKKNGELGPKSIERILKGYPEINTDWFIRGEGEMLLSSAPPSPPLAAGTRPRVDIYAAGGGNEALDGVTLAQCEQIPVVPQFPNYTFSMRVTGESMLPFIHPGDEVACLKIEESSFLQWGRIYVLFTSQGVIVKKIFDAGDGIRCVSFNENYPDFIIQKSEIYSFNLVIGLVRLCN